MLEISTGSHFKMAAKGRGLQEYRLQVISELIEKPVFQSARTCLYWSRVQLID